MNKPAARFLSEFQAAVSQNSFLKMTLSRPVGQEPGLKNLFFRPVLLLKKGQKIHVNFRFQTRDEVKNWSPNEAFSFLEKNLGTAWLNADLFLNGQILRFQTPKTGSESALLFEKTEVEKPVAPAAHDHQKTRLLSPAAPYLPDLGIANRQGEILKNAHDKWRQINKFLEIIDALLKSNSPSLGGGRGEAFRVADMGSGKGYLTFALFDFLKNRLGLDVKMEGIELRPGLVEFCNELAQRIDFQGLEFISTDINDWHPDRLDLLIALHACDTATDLAIAKGIRSGAEMIVVAPCCHKQIRREMSAKNELAPLLKHGILEERQAEILTDGIRALLLEAHGYRTQVFEFISTEHTAKNVMITAVKSRPNPDALARVEALKKGFGIGSHFLETLL